MSFMKKLGGGLLTIVSNKQVSLRNFSRNTRSKGLSGREISKMRRKNLCLLESSLGMGQDDRIRDRMV